MSVNFELSALFVKGVPRWRDRFPQYGIRVRLWSSGTLKIVIYVEIRLQKPKNGLAYYHPLWVLISGHIQLLPYMYI